MSIHHRGTTDERKDGHWKQQREQQMVTIEQVRHKQLNFVNVSKLSIRHMLYHSNLEDALEESELVFETNTFNIYAHI